MKKNSFNKCYQALLTNNVLNKNICHEKNDMEGMNHDVDPPSP